MTILAALTLTKHAAASPYNTNNEHTFFFQRQIYLWGKDNKPIGVPDQNTQKQLPAPSAFQITSEK